jgi:hypothetical protein
MERWLNAELNELDNRELDWGYENLTSNAASAEDYIAWRKADGPEIAAAEHGNIKPLRKKYPHLARFLHLPKQPGRGKRFPKNKNVSADDLKLTMAVWDVSRIRAIWKKHYRRHRPKSYASPEEIAARRWGVDEERVWKWKRSRLLEKEKFLAHITSIGDL